MVARPGSRAQVTPGMTERFHFCRKASPEEVLKRRFHPGSWRERSFLPALFVIATTWLRADQVALIPVADAELQSQAPAVNFGTGTTMVTGGLGSNAGNALRRALLRFEVAGQVPLGARVTSATLTFNLVREPLAPEDSLFQLRKILRPWKETQVTWNVPAKDTPPWDGSGCAGTNDVSAVVSGSVAISSPGVYVIPTTPGMVADVQGWLDNPFANDGWLLRSDTEAPFTARHIATRESGAAAPVLTVEFTPAPVLRDWALLPGGRWRFAFEAQAGVAYTAEFRETPGAGAWSDFTNFVAMPTNTVHVLELSTDGALALYRVRFP